MFVWRFGFDLSLPLRNCSKVELKTRLEMRRAASWFCSTILRQGCGWQAVRFAVSGIVMDNAGTESRVFLKRY